MKYYLGRNVNRNQRSYLLDNVWDCIQQEKIQCLLRDGCWFGEFEEKDIDKLVLADRISGLSSSIVSDTPNITPYQLLKNNRPAAATKRYKMLYEERTNCGQVSLSYVWNIMKRVRNKYSKVYLKNREI